MHLGRAGPIKYGCFALDLHCLMVKNKDMGETAISLVEFNRRIGGLLHDASVQRCWVVAETSDVRQSGGHCYLELVQKDAQTGQTLARMRGIVWASVYARLRCEFERATGQPFASGMNVMVEVSANFHEQYGLSVVITGINPTYTLGDMARQRLEILNRLRSEGIIDMNKQLPWDDVAQRVAVISAAGAAGYGDFMNQLHNNPSGIKFYTCLFPAVMQGQSTVTSVIAALERINDYADLFDCVVIIRGGGSTSDLNSFDNYDLAANVAQFPLPVICGIGHDRDNTVVDSVASVRVKTSSFSKYSRPQCRRMAARPSAVGSRPCQRTHRHGGRLCHADAFGRASAAGIFHKRHSVDGRQHRGAPPRTSSADCRGDTCCRCPAH